jgi:probable HAF family extracellular repeat protein
MKDIGAPAAPFENTLVTLGISPGGEVVGYASFVTSGWVPTTISHAFLYANGAWEDLNGLTSAPGWTLGTATAINGSGQIVGYGTVSGSTVAHAFLLTPLKPGDANGDGRVDINDLTIVLANFGQTGMTWSQGCMDGDPTGTLDINDLTIVLSHYGYGVSASAPSSVPEPSALVLLTVAACATGFASVMGRLTLRRVAGRTGAWHIGRQ